MLRAVIASSSPSIDPIVADVSVSHHIPCDTAFPSSYGSEASHHRRGHTAPVPNKPNNATSRRQVSRQGLIHLIEVVRQRCAANASPPLAVNLFKLRHVSQISFPATDLSKVSNGDDDEYQCAFATLQNPFAHVTGAERLSHDATLVLVIAHQSSPVSPLSIANLLGHIRLILLAHTTTSHMQHSGPLFIEAVMHRHALCVEAQILEALRCVAGFPSAFRESFSTQRCERCGCRGSTQDEVERALRRRPHPSSSLHVSSRNMNRDTHIEDWIMNGVDTTYSTVPQVSSTTAQPGDHQLFSVDALLAESFPLLPAVQRLRPATKAAHVGMSEPVTGGPRLGSVSEGEVHIDPLAGTVAGEHNELIHFNGGNLPNKSCCVVPSASDLADAERPKSAVSAESTPIRSVEAATARQKEPTGVSWFFDAESYSVMPTVSRPNAESSAVVQAEADARSAVADAELDELCQAVEYHNVKILASLEQAARHDIPDGGSRQKLERDDDDRTPSQHEALLIDPPQRNLSPMDNDASTAAVLVDRYGGQSISPKVSVISPHHRNDDISMQFAEEDAVLVEGDISVQETSALREREVNPASLSPDVRPQRDREDGTGPCEGLVAAVESIAPILSMVQGETHQHPPLAVQGPFPLCVHVEEQLSVRRLGGSQLQPKTDVCIRGSVCIDIDRSLRSNPFELASAKAGESDEGSLPWYGYWGIESVAMVSEGESATTISTQELYSTVLDVAVLWLPPNFQRVVDQCGECFLEEGSIELQRFPGSFTWHVAAAESNHPQQKLRLRVVASRRDTYSPDASHSQAILCSYEIKGDKVFAKHLDAFLLQHKRYGAQVEGLMKDAQARGLFHPPHSLHLVTPTTWFAMEELCKKKKWMPLQCKGKWRVHTSGGSEAPANEAGKASKGTSPLQHEDGGKATMVFRCHVQNTSSNLFADDDSHGDQRCSAYLKPHVAVPVEGGVQAEAPTGPPSLNASATPPFDLIKFKSATGAVVGWKSLLSMSTQQSRDPSQESSGDRKGGAADPSSGANSSVPGFPRAGGEVALVAQFAYVDRDAHGRRLHVPTKEILDDYQEIHFSFDANGIVSGVSAQVRTVDPPAPAKHDRSVVKVYTRTRSGEYYFKYTTRGPSK